MGKQKGKVLNPKPAKITGRDLEWYARSLVARGLASQRILGPLKYPLGQWRTTEPDKSPEVHHDPPVVEVVPVVQPEVTDERATVCKRHPNGPTTDPCNTCKRITRRATTDPDKCIRHPNGDTGQPCGRCASIRRAKANRG